MLAGTRLSPCTRGMETEEDRRDNVRLDGGVRTAGQWSPSRLSWGGRRRDRVSHGTFDEGSIGTIAQPARLRRGGDTSPEPTSTARPDHSYAGRASLSGWPAPREVSAPIVPPGGSAVTTAYLEHFSPRDLELLRSVGRRGAQSSDAGPFSLDDGLETYRLA